MAARRGASERAEVDEVRAAAVVPDWTAAQRAKRDGDGEGRELQRRLEGRG